MRKKFVSFVVHIERAMRIISLSFLGVLFLIFGSTSVSAAEVGVHILQIYELPKAVELLRPSVLGVKDTDEIREVLEDSAWTPITIPLVLDDLSKAAEWQEFFDTARVYRIQPIVRLTTRFNHEIGAWEVPTRKDVVMQVEFLERLNWPNPDKKVVIVYNEPNHAKEWGGKVAPEEYADLLQFSIDWMITSNAGFVILPGGVDLAAPNGRDVTTGHPTMEGLQFIRRMLTHQPRIAETIHAWNSHSYPNPAFSGTPWDTGKMSIRGYHYELRLLGEFTDREMSVYITETGWEVNRRTRGRLARYVLRAYQDVWLADSRVVAVTPFLLIGAPGPFAEMSYFGADGSPTELYWAFRSIRP